MSVIKRYEYPSFYITIHTHTHTSPKKIGIIIISEIIFESLYMTLEQQIIKIKENQ